MKIWNKDHFDLVENRNGQQVLVECQRPERSPRAFVMYRGKKVEVYVQSTFQGGSGLMANVVAAHGYPFLSSDKNAQGDTYGLWNCNGLRINANFVIVE